MEGSMLLALKRHLEKHSSSTVSELCQWFNTSESVMRSMLVRLQLRSGLVIKGEGQASCSSSCSSGCGSCPLKSSSSALV
jgi:hypothetical protein